MASHMQTLYCEIWLPTQLSLKKVMRDTVAICVQDESPKWTLSIICRINPKNKVKKNASLGLFMQKPPVSETSKGCRIESSPARSWSCQEDIRGGRISENSPSVAAGGCSALCPCYGMGQNPRRCGILHNSSALQEEALLPAAPGHHSAQGSWAWDSTTELLPKRGKEVCFPLSGWWNASDSGPYRP